jgi:outer membrane biosynthesis protein TonB
MDLKIGQVLKIAAIAATMLLELGSPASAQLPRDGPIPKRIVGLRYPRFAHLIGLQGKVDLVANIAQDGTVKNIREVTPANPLSDAAKESLSKWLFTGCDSESCQVKISFTFVLSGDFCAIDSNCPSDLQIDLPDRVEVKAPPARAIIN